MWSRVSVRILGISTRLLHPDSAVVPVVNARRYLQDRTRFYKNAHIKHSKQGWEVLLDKKKLKTPFGNVFQVPSEALALAVATEWNAQEKVIKSHDMHLTSLCNTAIDNPTHRNKEQTVDSIIHFLDTDTICYWLDEPEELTDLQNAEWKPMIEWLQHRYDISVEPTYGLLPPGIPEETRALLQRHLNSYTPWALVGFEYCTDALKSLILTLGVMDRHLSVEKAVELSRLELEFQIKRWGSVEWHHDIDLLELKARVAAAVLFVHMSTEFQTADAAKQTQRG
ncbi:ATP synthase mitochondrial F1 complex assembly factor 2 [Lingula anatina]|uniref:ATP synthase mitochondrial F1 complex assembly factor 2 n=1 Tax=Lingula anatina TaxID=7574 RepID=A0A1S3H643_LINAN|nr:ATP synthase mitochondrial F1 complex assembly factor 2 [Lingula anatina]|eukprot:XP_013380946.1 ATP synthase mitochondrial F1 complex assembly factor 2 [Lingula anatina]